MIKICPNCSRVNIDKLKKIVGEDDFRKGCIGRCGKPYIALVNYKAYEADSEEELIEYIENNK